MKLTLERIVDAGLATFAEFGYDELSMRRVAKRLDAQAGSLYYHVPSKEALVRLCADRVAQQAYESGSVALAALPGGADWPERVEAQAGALRRSILQHRGGAALLAVSPYVLSTGALSVMERLLETLASGGVPLEQRSVAADTVVSYVTGFVLQEQSVSSVVEMDTGYLATLTERFPMTMAQAGGDDDEVFVRSVRLLCAGIATVTDAQRVGGHVQRSRAKSSAMRC